MSDPLADPDDLASFWRPLTDSEQDVALSLIVVASALIRRRLPNIDTDMASGELDGDIVRYVVAEMIKSAVDGTNRPVDARSTSETVGPVLLSVTYAAASARLLFTDDLAALLGAPGSTQGLGSLRLGLPERYSGACLSYGQWYA